MSDKLQCPRCKAMIEPREPDSKPWRCYEAHDYRDVPGYENERVFTAAVVAFLAGNVFFFFITNLIRD